MVNHPTRAFWLCLAMAAAASGQDRASQGQSLFTANCATCHGGLGDGGSGPDLANPAWQATVTDDYLERVIRDGVPGTAMPSFGGRLAGADRRALVQHLRALAKTAIQPTTNVTFRPVHVDSRRLSAAAEDAVHDHSRCPSGGARCLDGARALGSGTR